MLLSPAYPPPHQSYLPPPSAPPVPEGTQYQDPPVGQSAAYVRALAMPPVIAEALLRLDGGCAPWICACLVEMLGPGFQLYRLRFHSASLWLPTAASLASSGPGARVQRTSVMLCDVPVNPPAGQEYYRDVWRELVLYFRGLGPAVPAHLISPTGTSRVRASLTALYLNIVPEAFKRQNDSLVADPGGPFSRLTNEVPKWLEGGKELPEHVVRSAIQFFAQHLDYVMTPSVIAEPKQLKKIVIGVVGVPVGGVPHVLSNSDLDMFAVSPMGDRFETIMEDQSNLVLEFGRDATPPVVRRGVRGGRSQSVADQNGLLIQVRLLLNSYLIASWVRCQLNPTEDRGWLEPRQIDDYINKIVAASEKVKSLTLCSMVSVVQTNWRSIRTASQSGQPLGPLLKQYGGELEAEARYVVSTVVATVQDESFVGMKRQLDQQAAVLESLAKAAGLAGLPPPSAAGTSEGSDFQRMSDGNPANPRECTRAGCSATDLCRFSHAKKPWNVDGKNSRYPGE